MNKWISPDKMSRKKVRILNAKRRNVWPINPVTRCPPNPRAYNRNKARKEAYSLASRPYNDGDF